MYAGSELYDIPGQGVEKSGGHRGGLLRSDRRMITQTFINPHNQSQSVRLQYSLIDYNLRTVQNDEDHDGVSQPNLSQRLVVNYCDGKWADILKDPLVLKYFQIDQSGRACLSTEYINSQDRAEETLIRLTVIATLLSAYVQINFTGPSFSHEPIHLFDFTNNTPSSEDRLNENSIELLSLAGEPAYHLAKSVTFLVLAIDLVDRLLSTSDSSTTTSPLSTYFPTIFWWKLRAEALHRRLLDEPVPFSGFLSQALEDLSVHHLRPLIEQSQSNKQQNDYDGDLLPMLTLERGLADHISGNEKQANSMFKKATTEASLKYVLTGMLGKKTKFQEKDISQLVLLAKGRDRGSCIATPEKSSTSLSHRRDAVESTKTTMPVTLPLNDDTLLEKTQFTSSTIDADSTLDVSDQPPLHPLDQSLLLALSLSIRNTSPSHGLTKAQMSPFIEKVLEHPANWSVHSMALLIRSRLESHRTRTVERGLLQLQALVEQLTKDAENDPVDKCTALERVRWTWSLGIPSKWELERELAQKLTGMGVTRSAMEIFERLEMWEQVVQCHLSLESKQLGIQLVRDLLTDKKIESETRMSKRRETRGGARLAKLWCLLAELESNPAHWTTAWEVSQHSSSRAMRCLGAHHFSNGDYHRAREYLSLALKINPLFQKTWFILGCAAMRQSDWDEAETAFRRCIALDDEDAEAWNNLATIYLKQSTLEEEQRIIRLKSTSKDPLTQTATDLDPSTTECEQDCDQSGFSDEEVKTGLSRPMAAFHALQQAVKLSYDSWKMWENYMVVAMSLGEYIESTRSLGRVLEIRGQQGLDEGVLSKLVDIATSKLIESHDSGTQNRLLERLKDIMDRVVLVKCPNDVRVWQARARLDEFEGEFKNAIDRQLTAYRVGVSQDIDNWSHNIDAWQSAVVVVRQTVNNLLLWGPMLSKEEQTTLNWRWHCKSILSSFLNKSKSAFEDHSLWLELQSRLDEFSLLAVVHGIVILSV